MALLIYGHGGLLEIPSSIEEDILSAAVGSEAKVESVATHTSTAIDGISPVLTAADVGRKIFSDDIPFNTTIVAIAPGGASATLDTAASATAAAHNAVVYPGTGLAGAKVQLFTNTISPPFKLRTIADLTAPIFDGYAPSSACVWSPPFLTITNNAIVTADKKQFVCTGPTASPDVTGAALVTPDGLTLLQLDVFTDADGNPAPVVMTQAGNGFDYVPVVTLT